MEIIIVNDGSTDCTAQIADKYKEDYPDVVKVIIRKMAGMVKQLIQVFVMPRDYSLK